MTAPVMVGPSPQGIGPAPCPDWDDVLADIGDRIRAERQARGWSETELGRRAGIARTTVRRLENGDASLRCFIQACTALEIPAEQLLSPQWRHPASTPVRGPGLSKTPTGLSERQALVLREAASGDSLSQVAARLDMDVQAVGAVLSRAYQRLGVALLPRNQRRAAAVRVAIQHGLFDAANRTS